MNIKNQTSLRRILIGNAIFSGGSGLLSVIASKPIAQFIGIDASLVIMILGLGLVGYAVSLYASASRVEITRSAVMTAVLSDSTWVLLSILLLATGWVSFSVAGKWAVGIVAVIVDIFATLQFIEWRKMGEE